MIGLVSGRKCGDSGHQGSNENGRTQTAMPQVLTCPWKIKICHKASPSITAGQVPIEDTYKT